MVFENISGGGSLSFMVFNATFNNMAVHFIGGGNF